jgi:DNA-binding NtrC family response regulator
MAAFSRIGAASKNQGDRRSSAARPSPTRGGAVEYDGWTVHEDDMSIVGAGTGLKAVVRRVEQVAPTDAPVLLEGETGSGKEVIARLVHARSRRANGPMVRVNCGAIPPELVDSELFGHERGSFTGASATRLGWFERANGGTLFLDEIAELPPAAQVRLLRVLSEGTLERVGGSRVISVSVRVVTATHRDLPAMCAAGAFREDLWYRIGVFRVRIPPLRERREDLPELVAHFARRAGVRITGVPLTATPAELDALLRYDWPGNVRELAAVVERAAILGGGRRLDVAAALGDAPRTKGEVDGPARFPTLAEATRAHVERALVRASGRVEGRGGAADLLGVNPHTLRGRMRKLGIDWTKYR